MPSNRQTHTMHRSILNTLRQGIWCRVLGHVWEGRTCIGKSRCAMFRLCLVTYHTIRMRPTGYCYLGYTPLYVGHVRRRCTAAVHDMGVGVGTEMRRLHLNVRRWRAHPVCGGELVFARCAVFFLCWICVETAARCYWCSRPESIVFILCFPPAHRGNRLAAHLQCVNSSAGF